MLRSLGFLFVLLALTACIAFAEEPKDSAHIVVVVRTREGDPVKGLAASDFVVEERGKRYAVELARSDQEPYLRSRGQGNAKNANGSESSQSVVGGSSKSDQSALGMKTQTLLLIPPLNPASRSYLLKSAIEHIQIATEYGWNVALLDPSEKFTPFSGDIHNIVAALKGLQAQVDRNQYSGSWVTSARQHISELSYLPGRHVIILACDTELNDVNSDPNSVMAVPLNPWRFHVFASAFEQDARIAMAQLYLIQTGGPGTTNPFGDASNQGGSLDSSNPGPEILEQVISQDMASGRQRAELMGVANDTGGRVEMDMDDALKDAHKDASGYYDLVFRPDLSMLDGGYHEIKVTVRNKEFRVFANTYYHAPHLLDAKAVSLDGWDALETEHSTGDLDIKPRAWYFPDRSNGLATVPIAAELSIPEPVNSAGNTTTARLAAAIFDERQRGYINSWTETVQLSNIKGSSSFDHGYWQQTVHLPPGSYQLRVAANDKRGPTWSSASWRFLIRSPDPNSGLNVSSMLLGRSCVPLDQLNSRSHDLLDPLNLGKCRLQPSAAPTYSEEENVFALLRIYPGKIPVKGFPDKWHASVSIFNKGDDNPRSVSVPIQRASGPGWIVLAMIPLKDIALPPGDYQIRIDMVGPKGNAVAKQARFEVRRH